MIQIVDDASLSSCVVPVLFEWHADTEQVGKGDFPVLR